MHALFTSRETTKKVLIVFSNVEAVVEAPLREGEKTGSVIKLASGFDIEVTETVAQANRIFGCKK